MGLEKLIEKKRILIVCGVGGVGKTTLSAALGLKAAMQGKKALVITVDPAKRLADLLNLKSPCPEPKLVWKASTPHPTLSHKGRGVKEGGHLWACLLEAKQTFDHLIARHASPEIQEIILQNPIYQQLSLMMAGTQEYMAMEKLYSLQTDEKFDLIVIDTPPAKHAIDFLLAPLRMINMINDSILRWLITPTLKMGTFSSKIFQALSLLSGKEILEEIAQFLSILFTLLDGFTKRSEAIQSLLTGKQCAFLMATDSRRAFSLEGQTLRGEFQRLGFELEGILINRLPPSFGKESEVLAALRWARKQKESHWKIAGEFLAKNLKAQAQIQTQLKSLTETIPNHALIPEITEGVLDLEDLKKITAHL